jgi:hypothetical protein
MVCRVLVRRYRTPLAEPHCPAPSPTCGAGLMGGEGKALTGHPPGFEHGYEVHHHPAEPVNNTPRACMANAFGP